MEVTQNMEYTREKQQALLIGCYKKAIALLQSNSSRQEGKTILKDILKNPDSLQPALRQLRLSTLLSLGELSKMEGQLTHALYYWYEATRIQSCFNTWIKMTQVLQQIRENVIQRRIDITDYKFGLHQIQQQIQYAYKSALKESPALWRQQLVKKLHQTYIKHNKKLQAKDLQQLISNNTYQSVLLQKIPKQPNQINEQHQQSSIKQSKQTTHLPQLKIPIYYFLPDQNTNDQLVPWDYLITLCNFLINQHQNQNQMVMGSKKYMKRYEEVLSKLGKFSLEGTSLFLVVKKEVSGSRSMAVSEFRESQKSAIMSAFDENSNKVPIMADNKQEDINRQSANQNQMLDAVDRQQKQQHYLLQDQIQQNHQGEKGKYKQSNKPTTNQKKQPSSTTPPIISQQAIQQKTYNFMLDIHRDTSKDTTTPAPQTHQQKPKKLQLPASTSGNKAIFETLLDYYRQIFLTKSINLCLFTALRYVDPQENEELRGILGGFGGEQEPGSGSQYCLVIQPMIQGIVRIQLEREKEKDRDKEKQVRDNPAMNQQQQQVSTRQRRSINPNQYQTGMTPNRQKSNVHAQSQSDDNKQLEQNLNIFKEQFVNWINTIPHHRFTNVIELTASIIKTVLDIYEKMNIDDCFDNIQKSESMSFANVYQTFKSTNRILAQLITKLFQLTHPPFLSQTPYKTLQISRLLLKYLQQQSNINPNSLKLASVQPYLLNLCHTSIDSILYRKSMGRNSSRELKYSIEEVNLVLGLVYVCIVGCCLPNFIDQGRIRYYVGRYQQMYAIKVGLENEFGIRDKRKNDHIIQPARLCEMIQTRIRKSKLRQLSQQEYQQSVLMASIDKLLKADMKTSQTIQSVKSIMSINSGSILFYLKSFSKVVDMLFNNLQNNNGFNNKFVQNALKVMEIPTIIQSLFTKLTEDKRGSKQVRTSQVKPNLQQQKLNQMILQNSQAQNKANMAQKAQQLQKSDYKLKICTMFKLIKIYLLSQLSQSSSSQCIRIILYLLEKSLQSMNDFYLQSLKQTKSKIPKYIDLQLDVEVRQPPIVTIHYKNSQSICKIIILMDSLIKMRESADVRKRFYQRILITNIRYIYDLYFHKHTSPPNQIRLQIYKIFSDTFHSKSFKPRKLQDCLGYFLMISRQFASQFEKQEVQFQQKMKRVFNECYVMFKEQFPKSIKYCDRFCRAMECFVIYMKKRTKQLDSIVNFLTSQQVVCQCCQAAYLNNDIGRQKYAKQVLLVVAKYLQNKKNQQKTITPIQNKEQNSKTQQKQNLIKKQVKTASKLIQIQDQVENYYLKYFLLAINTGKAWYQMLRFQISKVYAYFDAVLEPQLVQQQTANVSSINQQSLAQVYKHKFKYAKTIASFIIKNQSSQDFNDAKQYALYRINIINTLKLRQRKLHKKYSQILKFPQLVVLHTSKYMQGIITILVNNSQKQQEFSIIDNRLPEVSYLRYTELKLPFLLYQCENLCESGETARVWNGTIDEGIGIVRDVVGDGDGGRMVDEAEVYREGSGREVGRRGMGDSKYVTKHLQKQLKVEILSTISQAITTTLQSIVNIRIGMIKVIEIEGDFRKFSRPKYQSKQKYNTLDAQNKLHSKFLLLLTINNYLNSHIHEFRSWRPQLTQKNYNINQMQNEAPDQETDKKFQNMEKATQKQIKGAKLQFKQKYLFPDYSLLLGQIMQKLQLIVQILDHISKQNANNRTKKQNYSRYIFNANLTIMKIYHKYGLRQQCLNYVKEVSNLKNQDLVNFYHHYENQPTQQNLVLAELYSRDIVFNYTKIQAVENLLEIYSKPDTLETSIMLIRKLSKMFTQKIQKIDKQNQKDKDNKQKDKDKEKQKQKNNEKEDQTKDKDGKIKSKKGQQNGKGKIKEEKQKQKQIKKQKQTQKQKKNKKQSKQTKQNKQGKQAKDKSTKNSTKIQKRIKWAFILFLRGFQIYLEAMINEVNEKNQRLDQKYQRAIPQFKNKIKRQIEKQKKKASSSNLLQLGVCQIKYAMRLVADSQQFMSQYQNKFKIKIRMKAPKKKNQGQEQKQGQCMQQKQKNQNIQTAKPKKQSRKKSMQLQKSQQTKQKKNDSQLQKNKQTVIQLKNQRFQPQSQEPNNIKQQKTGIYTHAMTPNSINTGFVSRQTGLQQNNIQYLQKQKVQRQRAIKQSDIQQSEQEEQDQDQQPEPEPELQQQESDNMMQAQAQNDNSQYRNTQQKRLKYQQQQQDQYIMQQQSQQYQQNQQQLNLGLSLVSRKMNQINNQQNWNQQGNYDINGRDIMDGRNRDEEHEQEQQQEEQIEDMEDGIKEQEDQI